MATQSVRMFVLVIATVGFVLLPACNRKERVLDIKTPEGGIEVDRDKRTGDIEIRAESNER